MTDSAEMPAEAGPAVPDESDEPASRRDRPAKELLSRAAIIDAALELVRRSGLESVTLRQVAAQLDTGAASLYVYVANRDDLLRRMLDRVLSEVEPVPVKPKRWRRRLAELFTEMLAVLDRYPGIATVALSSLPAPSSSRAIRANGLELLAAGGVKEQQASWICDSLLLHTIATAVEVDHDPDRFAFAIAALIESGRDH